MPSARVLRGGAACDQRTSTHEPCTAAGFARSILGGEEKISASYSRKFSSPPPASSEQEPTFQAALAANGHGLGADTGMRRINFKIFNAADRSTVQTPRPASFCT